MKKTNTQRLVFTSMMAAIVYITSAFLQISIPTVIGSTRLHMGFVAKPKRHIQWANLLLCPHT